MKTLKALRQSLAAVEQNAVNAAIAADPRKAAAAAAYEAARRDTGGSPQVDQDLYYKLTKAGGTAAAIWLLSTVAADRHVVAAVCPPGVSLTALLPFYERAGWTKARLFAAFAANYPPHQQQYVEEARKDLYGQPPGRGLFDHELR